MICRQFTVFDGRTSVIFGRGEIKIVFNQVPARVCPGCGEAYLEEGVALDLLLFAEKMVASGEKEHKVGFDDLKAEICNP